jgi:RND superfamily putative drug exporter
VILARAFARPEPRNLRIHLRTVTGRGLLPGGYGPRVPEPWTRAVLRHRRAVLAAWAAIVVAGVAAAIGLPARLATSFAVPGTESQRAQALLERHFGERPDGTFTVVFRVRHPSDRALQQRLQHELEVVARAVPTGHVDGRLLSGGGILYGTVATTLDLQHAKRWTEPLRQALRDAGGPPALVTGQPAIQHDLDPLLGHDLRRGEALALPVALGVLLLVLGLSLAVVVPFVVATCTIAATLCVVWALAHELTLVSFVPNLVELLGIGLAVDYSLLVVSRFREELERENGVEDAIVRTAATAGRAVLVSGLTVAIGLALLLLVPVPFVRSLGLAGLIVPLASIAAAATLQPVLLVLLGRRAGRARPEHDRLWEGLAYAVMRRPWVFLAGGAALLVAAALPAFFLRLTPGSFAALPRGPEAIAGVSLLRERAGAGVLTPIEIVVDGGRPRAALTPAVHGAVERLADATFHDPAAYVTALGRKPPFVDPTRRYARLVVVPRHEYGDPTTRALVDRLRRRLVPDARFPPGTRVDVGGAPAQGVDYLDRTYGAFAWLLTSVLLLTYLVLLRGFRSVVLPLKAVVLNLLTVAAVYGLLVAIFQWGTGSGPIEAWIPILLFALLFGLSMDYEVFIVTRMREAWDAEHDNRAAVAHGLARTGRIVTAAAVIMVAAFMGFAVGRVESLRVFGVGLSLAVLLDATLVRAVLVPAVMAVLDRWNWWLPPRLARLVRAPASSAS